MSDFFTKPNPDMYCNTISDFKYLTEYFKEDELEGKDLVVEYILDPNKLKEYLSGGVPVVSIRIPEIEGTADFVHIADSFEQFEAMVKTCIEQDQSEKITRGINFARQESWESRIEFIDRVLSDSLHLEAQI